MKLLIKAIYKYCHVFVFTLIAATKAVCSLCSCLRVCCYGTIT